MSRRPGAAAQAGPSRLHIQDSSGRITEHSTPTDRCPVCRSDRFLNPRLRLLVSTTCYHQMCESCIDRIFTLGPEPCPICGVLLRKTSFAAQTFGDLRIEKEVSVRKRIARCFNKKQSDFSDLKEFNDYLEEVEDITFNLINSVDVQETEARIKAFQQANAALISKNARQDAVEAARIREQDADDRKKREKARQLAAEREATDAAEREASEKALVARLEKTTDQSEIDRLVKESRLAAQKRRDQASTVSEDFLRLMRPPSPEPASRRQQGRDNELEDAPRDRYYDYSDMFHLGDYLSDPVTALKDPVARARADAGGFRNEAVWERHVRSAVQGLFCRPLDWPAEEVQLAGKA